MSNFGTALAFVKVAEGGFSIDPNDRGNYTPDGRLVGTKYGISARAYPALDIPNITREEAAAIYRRDYWDRIDADSLPWPLSLVAFDDAVNAGVGAARKRLALTQNPYEYIALRLQHYTGLRTWQHHGRGWTRRMAELLSAVAAETFNDRGDNDSGRYDITRVVLNTARGATVITLDQPVGARLRDDKLDLAL